MKKFLLIFLLLTVSAISGCSESNIIPKNSNSGDPQKIRLVITTSGADGGIDTLTALKIAELVEKDSGGKIKIEVYPNDKLAGGNTTKDVEELANGSVDFAIFPSGTYSAIDPGMAVATIPWIFSTYRDARKVIDETGGKYYEKILAKKGIVYLGSFHNGFRQIANNVRPIRMPEDFTDLKIRILGNRDTLHFFRMFNAVPVPMSTGELIDAMNKGSIDGHDIGLFQAYSRNLNNVEKYLTIWNYSYENYIIAATGKTFYQLDGDTQKLIREKVIQACEMSRNTIERSEREIKMKTAASGVEIIELTPEELQPFKDRARPLIEKLKEDYGEDACRAFNIK